MGMSERRFVNPSRIVLSDALPYYYPISNIVTPVLDLCVDIPSRESGRSLAVCLLKAGDIRNVLYNTYKRSQIGDQSSLDFYVNDNNLAAVARGILLLTLAAQTPQGDSRRLTEFVDFFVHVYADLFLDGNTRSRVDTVLEDLINNFPAEGSTLIVSERDQLWHLKKTWALWLIDQQEVTDLRRVREAKRKVYNSKRCPLPVDNEQILRTYFGGSSDLDSDKYVEIMVYVDVMSNSDMAATPRMRNELVQYYESGNIDGHLHLRDRLNPTLFDQETKEFPHFVSNPFQPFITAAEAGDYNIDNQTLLATLKSSLKRLLSVFSRELNSGNVQVTFDVGDCNSFLSERLPANAAFDVIDTLNLADNLGLINLLVLGIPRLNRDEPHSTLWTATVKAHSAYDNLDEFLLDSLGFPYVVVSTMLQTVSTVPFESSYAFDDESGVRSRPNVSTGLHLKWKNAFLASEPRSNAFDLAPNPNLCFFRQFVDRALSYIYDSYTGRICELAAGNRKESVSLPRECTFTVSTIIRVLCQAAKMVKRPRQLFDYLYEKVRFIEQTRPIDPEERFFGVFALDVQMTAALTCPDEYKPLEPLHPLLAASGHETLETRTCTLAHTDGRIRHPSPILGWVLLDKYSPLDDSSLRTIPRGVPRTLGDNTFSYIVRNVPRLQFIDSVSVSFPDKEALVTLPSSLFTSSHRYALVGISILDGTVLYSSITNTVMAGATTVSQQTQTLEYVNPTAAELLTDSDDSQRVSVLREYPDRFDGIIESKTQLKATWMLTSEKAGPLVRLRIGFNPTCDSAATESIHVSVCLPTDVEVNSVPRFVEFVDERKVKFSLPKLQSVFHPRKEKIDLESLGKWPVGRPLGVGVSMFTVPENTAAASSGGLPFGHDVYLDTRKTVFFVYNAFIDQHVKTSRQIIKLREDGKKLFHSISSLEKGFIAYTPELKITPLGTPVIELQYLDSTGEPSPEILEFITYVNSPPRMGDHEVITTRGTDEKTDVLLDLLRRNARLMNDEVSCYVGSVRMKRSFVIPIYSKEGWISARQPNESRSACMEEHAQWRRDHDIPPKPGDLHDQNHQSESPQCFTCSSTSSDLKRCGRCQQVWFCNRECQKEGWKRHKQHCRSGDSN